MVLFLSLPDLVNVATISVRPLSMFISFFFFMTGISGCDGRYLSLAQQRRAWEELNQVFGGKTPVPPGPDPPDPDPGETVYREYIGFRADHWVQDTLRPYIVRVPLEGTMRAAFALRENLHISIWSWPQVGFAANCGFYTYRNGELVRRAVFRVEVTSAAQRVMETLIYDPGEGLWRFSAPDRPDNVISWHASVPDLAEEQTYVVFASCDDHNQSTDYVVCFSYWQVAAS